MLEDVNDWLGELPHRHKVVIAGNHDLVFQKEPGKARSLLAMPTTSRTRASC